MSLPEHVVTLFSSGSVFSVMKSEHVSVERVLMEVYFCQEQKFIVERVDQD